MTTEGLYLRIVEEHRNGYGHFRLHPVMRTFSNDSRGWEVAANFWGDNFTDVKVREYVNSLKGLAVYCQWNETGDDTFRPYAISATFHEINVESVDQAREIVRVLGRLERGLQKFAEKFGRTDDFGVFAQRVGMVLGCEGFCIPKNPGDWEWTDNSHSVRTLAELPEYISWKLHKENRL